MSTLDALQTTLAAEHAAVYVYGVLGGQTSRTSDPALFTAVSAAYGAHRARRDALTRFVADLGGTPVAAQASYELPAALGTATAVSRTALGLEVSCASTYAFLVASTVGPRRRWAVTALRDASVRELGFGGAPAPFPGS